MARLSDSITYGDHTVTGDLFNKGVVFEPVTITGSGATTVTGSYPNFTVSSTGVTGDDVTTISTNTTATNFTFYNFTAVVTLTLPASPTIGDWVRVSNFSGGNPTIARNGSNIMELAEDLTIDKANAAFTLTYLSASQGWVIN